MKHTHRQRNLSHKTSKHVLLPASIQSHSPRHSIINIHSFTSFTFIHLFILLGDPPSLPPLLLPSVPYVYNLTRWRHVRNVFTKNHFKENNIISLNNNNNKHTYTFYNTFSQARMPLAYGIGSICFREKNKCISEHLIPVSILNTTSKSTIRCKTQVRGHGAKAFLPQHNNAPEAP